MSILSHKQFEGLWNFWTTVFSLSFVFGVFLFLAAIFTAGSSDYDSSEPILGTILIFILGWFALITSGYWLSKLVYNEKTFLDYCNRGPLWTKKQ